PKWMRQVLVTGRSIRPYMMTRMPKFGLANVEHLVESFRAVDGTMSVSLPELPNTKEIRTAATEMIGRQGLNCIACHTFQNKGADAMPAVDLTEMAERLELGWFYQYMVSPQSIRPNTVMPSFWPGGASIRKDLMDGDAQRQIAAIWGYLQNGRQASTPRGLQIEPIELLARGDEAVMLRRSYPGIGKRGIGVGYPGQINLAFDAEQMRLAMLWKGGFADPGGVWRGQGHGRVRPLSSEVITMDAGPDLDSLADPWQVDDGRPPSHQFTGYFLDSKRRPTFTYLFDGVEVADYFLDENQSSGDISMTRQIVLASTDSKKGLRYRVASGKKIETVDDRSFLIDQKLRVVLPEGVTVKVTSSDQGQALCICFDIDSNGLNFDVQYMW
ncbi:hypothetical protein OAA27_02195, partial [bacterium]|nr:hypothetical protein [bacterium]